MILLKKVLLLGGGLYFAVAIQVIPSAQAMEHCSSLLASESTLMRENTDHVLSVLRTRYGIQWEKLAPRPLIRSIGFTLEDWEHLFKSLHSDRQNQAVLDTAFLFFVMSKYHWPSIEENKNIVSFLRQLIGFYNTKRLNYPIEMSVQSFEREGENLANIHLKIPGEGVFAAESPQRLQFSLGEATATDTDGRSEVSHYFDEEAQDIRALDGNQAVTVSNRWKLAYALTRFASSLSYSDRPAVELLLTVGARQKEPSEYN